MQSSEQHTQENIELTTEQKEAAALIAKDLQNKFATLLSKSDGYPLKRDDRYATFALTQKILSLIFQKNTTPDTFHETPDDTVHKGCINSHNKLVIKDDVEYIFRNYHPFRNEKINPLTALYYKVLRGTSTDSANYSLMERCDNNATKIIYGHKDINSFIKAINTLTNVPEEIRDSIIRTVQVYSSGSPEEFVANVNKLSIDESDKSQIITKLRGVKALVFVPLAGKEIVKNLDITKLHKSAIECLNTEYCTDTQLYQIINFKKVGGSVDLYKAHRKWTPKQEEFFAKQIKEANYSSDIQTKIVCHEVSFTAQQVHEFNVEKLSHGMISTYGKKFSEKQVRDLNDVSKVDSFSDVRKVDTLILKYDIQRLTPGLLQDIVKKFDLNKFSIASIYKLIKYCKDIDPKIIQNLDIKQLYNDGKTWDKKPEAQYSKIFSKDLFALLAKHRGLSLNQKKTLAALHSLPPENNQNFAQTSEESKQQQKSNTEKLSDAQIPMKSEQQLIQDNKDKLQDEKAFQVMLNNKSLIQNEKSRSPSRN